MCGRFVLTLDYATLVNILKGRFHMEDLPPSHDYKPRYNIAPTTSIMTLVGHKDKHRCGYLTWGMPLSFTSKKNSLLINSRSESLLQKAKTTNSLLQKRCIILANGFYEWRRVGKHSIPMFVHLSENKLFAMAGIYSTTYNESGEKVSTCAIITTSANAHLSSIHHRMPVILPEEKEALWLHPDTNNDQLKPLLVPYDGAMYTYQVSSLVNSSTMDTRACMEPFCETLF